MECDKAKRYSYGCVVYTTNDVVLKLDIKSNIRIKFGIKHVDKQNTTKFRIYPQFQNDVVCCVHNTAKMIKTIFLA